jgi:hypothetical protein
VRLLLIGLFATSLAARALAQEAEAPSGSEIQQAPPAAPAVEAPPGRVGRLSLVSGNVSVRTPDGWADATLNLPLSAGDLLRTGANARAEIEIGADTIDLSADTELEITTLGDLGMRITVARGRIGLGLARLGDIESVEVDVARQGVAPVRPGRYDIDADRERIAVFAGATRLVGEAADVDVGTGEIALLADPASTAAVEPATRDDFVEWCDSREFDEQHLVAPYYISPSMTGFAELDAAGRWERTAEYDAVWIPNGLPADWAPYRNGHWRWVGPWGWTWIDDHPWGFAPFHYGRWTYFADHWGWVPGRFVAHAVYMPAAVAFLGTRAVGLSVADSTVPAIAWFALAPGEVYWPAYTLDLDYVRKLNLANVADVGAIQLDADGEPPLEVFDGHFANRRFASVVPRPVFLNGGEVAPALLSLPEQRLQNAPVLMGSPQISPAPHRVVAAAAMVRPPSRRSVWTSHIAVLVERSAIRAKILQAARVRGAHLRAPAYAQVAVLRHAILLKVAHTPPAAPHGATGRGSRH